MEILGIVLAGVGGLTMVIGGLMLIVAAFRVSIWWGLGMFVPILGAIVKVCFLLFHWEEAKTPFLTTLAGVGIGVVGIVLNPSIMEETGEVNAFQRPASHIASTR